MTQSRVLAIGDPHAKASNTTEIRELADKIKAKILELNPTIIVILGDLANDFEKIHVQALNSIVYFFETLKSTGRQVYYIVGNHDMISNQNFLVNSHAFNAFKNWEGLEVIDEPAFVDEFMFCPYVPPGRLKEALKSVGQYLPKTAALFCHQEFRGAKLGMKESTVGDIWPENFPLAVSGHIHDYGWLQPNLLYVGAPRPVAFSESVDKTISFLTFDDGKFTKEERIDLGMPRRTTVNLEVVQALKYVIPENTFVRINILGTSEEISKFKKSDACTILSESAKVIYKYTDKIIVKTVGVRTSYSDILRRTCEKESIGVRKALEEIFKDSNAA